MADGEGGRGQVLHLDVDAFFAQAEVLRRPELVGRAVVVAGTGRRAVVASATYEARAHGVTSAMPVGEAQRRCRSLVVVPVDLGWYRELSWEVVAAVASVGPGSVERIGLDECYLQLDDGVDTRQAAVTAQAMVRARCSLASSVGVGPTREVAKLASEAAKPGGTKVVGADEVAGFVAGHQLSALGGVGPATLARLERFGITSVRQALDAGEATLAQVLGEAAGAGLWRTVHDGGGGAVDQSRQRQSMGCSETFPVDVVDRDELARELERLGDEAVARLWRSGKGASTVVVRARSGAFEDATRSRRLGAPVMDAGAVRDAVLSCVDELFGACRGRVRGAGVTLTGLSRAVQLGLWQDAGDLRPPVPGPGEAVVHEVFGQGTVVDSDPGCAVVRFADRVRVITDPGGRLGRPEPSS